MAHLIEIKDFIQTVTEAITHSLEIESAVVDDKLTRIAGTVKGVRAVPDGIMYKAIETGRWYIIENPREDEHCLTCSGKDECDETASLDCPIFLDGKVIGAMGLVCKDSAQKERLISKKQSLLSFIQGMCELISSRLKEREMLEKIEVHNIMLNQILNTVSDGYIIVNNENIITNINKYALRILSKNKEDVNGKSIDEVIPDLDIKSVMRRKEYTSYDQAVINNNEYGIFITAMRENEKSAGAVISFKKVDKISSRVYSRAFRDKIITFEAIIGKSKAITSAKELASLVSSNNANILLLGESGTGKELFARAIHFSSNRRDNPFISVNCAAIPKDLLESELFGYEAGAFTGASRTGKIGKFELADKGTIFLDEIGDMPFYLQAKLLRVLQDRTIERVGGIEQKEIDLRIIAATNKNLEKMVHEGKFREDLYYRLNVIPITIPPLRQRQGDIRLLVEYFIDEYCRRFDMPNKALSAEAMDIISSYDWPGNVRELENLVQYLISVSNDRIINTSLLPGKLFKEKSQTVQNKIQQIQVIPMHEIEKKAILDAIKLYGNSTEGKMNAAKALGLSKTTLYRKLAEYKVI